jgi:hypothetical protein
MSSSNKRKPIKHAEVPLLKRAAILGYWWYSKGSGDDGRQHQVAVAAAFGIAQQTISDIIRKAKLHARESLADREKLMLEVRNPKDWLLFVGTNMDIGYH